MKKLTTKILIIAAIVTFGSFVLPVAINANAVNVYVDGEQVEFADQQPIFMGSGRRTIIPVRAVFEAMGYNVEWHGTDRRVTLSRYNVEIALSVARNTHTASNLLTVNGEYMPLGTPVMLLGDRTMLPINDLLERMGHLYEWDNSTRTLNIQSLSGSVSWDFTPGALTNQISLPEIGEEFAIIHTNMGEIRLRLFPNLAPLAVENFVTHARNNYYDGLAFHRVISDFMIQSGDPTDTGSGGKSIWGAPFGNETTPNLRHIRGAVSMANDGERQPISNNSQFFIVQGDDLYYRFVPELERALSAQYEIMPDGLSLGELFPSEFEFIQHYLEHGGWPHLDFGHTVFGQVFYGLDVVDAITAVATDQNNRPLVEIVIYRIEILEFEGYDEDTEE